jgi:hypothetical protein
MRIIDPIAINDTILTDSNVPEDDHPEWDASTAYIAGDNVIVISTHRIYEALQATTGDDPATDDGTNWLDIGATNRYRAFDGSIEGQTVQASSIQYEFTLTGNFGGLALLNIIGAEVTVNITDPVDGALDPITVGLSDTSGVVDWFTYFYSPVIQRREIIFSDLPIYAGAIVTVEITGTGDVALGELALGVNYNLGVSTTGTSLGIEDFSTKRKDDFGRTFILERAFANIVSFEFSFPSETSRRVRRVLSDLRAKPAVYYTESDQIDLGGTVYGFPRDFRINLQTPTVAFATLEIEGLT